MLNTFVQNSVMEITSQPSNDDKYEKYMDLFRKSRSRVKLFEEGFRVKHGRKPNKDDLVRIYKNMLIFMVSINHLFLVAYQKTAL
jgi:hypothetical protein